MKKILMVISLQLLTILVLQAQDCATGYCPETLTVQHKAGEVSPRSVTITYEVVESTLSGDTACWIARNLGATALPSSYNNDTYETIGWLWQFNRKQGYYLQDATTRIPNAVNWISEISEDSDWLAENDPCRILLGSNWRIPTVTEYQNVVSNGSFGGTDNMNFYNSELKFFESDYYLYYGTGEQYTSLSQATKMWTSNQYTSDNTKGYYFFDDYDSSATTLITNITKSYGLNLRCIRSYR